MNVFPIKILKISPGKILQKGRDGHFWFHFWKQWSIWTIPRFSTVFKVSSTPVSPFDNTTTIATSLSFLLVFLFSLWQVEPFGGWIWSQNQLQRNGHWAWSIFVPKYNFSTDKYTLEAVLCRTDSCSGWPEDLYKFGIAHIRTLPVPDRQHLK